MSKVRFQTVSEEGRQSRHSTGVVWAKRTHLARIGMAGTVDGVTRGRSHEGAISRRVFDGTEETARQNLDALSFCCQTCNVELGILA